MTLYSLLLRRGQTHCATACHDTVCHPSSSACRCLPAPAVLLLLSFIGYSLLGIEGITLELEQPFGRDFNDLPLDMLCLDMLEVRPPTTHTHTHTSTSCDWTCCR